MEFERKMRQAAQEQAHISSLQNDVRNALIETAIKNFMIGALWTKTECEKAFMDIRKLTSVGQRGREQETFALIHALASQALEAME